MAYDAEYHRQRRAEKLEAGLCPMHAEGNCDGLLPGLTMCQRSIDFKKARDVAMIADGLCLYHARRKHILAVPGSLYCAACNKKAAAKAAKCIKFGFCPKHAFGVAKALPGLVYCADCQVFHQNDYQERHAIGNEYWNKQRREERKAASAPNGLPVSAETL